jgi:preprotein translocase subunit YajC
MDLLFPLLIVFMIGMIFFSSRQRKKQQQQQDSLQSSIMVGDIVVMTCGVSGTVVDTDDEKTIDLEIAPEVITTWLRAAVREKLSSDADVAHEHLDPDDTEHAVPSALTDGSLGHTGNGSSAHGSTAHGSSTNGAASANGSSAETAAPSTPASEPQDGHGSSHNDDFADPTASPSSNGASDSRSS